MLRSSVMLVCGLFAVVAARSAPAQPAPPAEPVADNKPTIITKTFKSEDGGIYGVASYSSNLASRNGRVSSMSGINFYPGPNMQDNSITLTKSTNNKLPEPITFSKEENGKYTSGTIKIGPSGSVSVSSIARSGFPDQASSKPKIDDNMFFASLPTFNPHFNARSMNPWYSNNVNFMPFRYNSFRPSWTYPTFNPYFNSFW